MLRRLRKAVVFYAAFVVLLTGCSTYKQGILFRTTGVQPTPIQQEAHLTERNYVIQMNDQLSLDVFSNKGERVVDPNGELLRQQGANVTTNQRRDITYFVDQEGMLKAPMVGPIRLAGLTIREAELLLQKEYDRYYKECYVVLTFKNKRVTVLGVSGGQVVPLATENMRLAEVLALAKGVTSASKAKNIRVLRGNETFLVDFSTVEGFQQGNLILMSGDVIYVEPVVRPFVEGFRDASPIISLILSITTLTLLIVNNQSTN